MELTTRSKWSRAIAALELTGEGCRRRRIRFIRMGDRSYPSSVDLHTLPIRLVPANA